jgi:hypothetical protein
MDRRTFLKRIAQTAVASQLPAKAEVEVEFSVSEFEWVPLFAMGGVATQGKPVLLVGETACDALTMEYDNMLMRKFAAALSIAFGEETDYDFYDSRESAELEQ